MKQCFHRSLTVNCVDISRTGGEPNVSQRGATGYRSLCAIWREMLCLNALTTQFSFLLKALQIVVRVLSGDIVSIFGARKMAIVK